MERREFTRRSSLAGALGAGSLFLPARVRGANDRLSYGLIGTGGRGRYLSSVFRRLGAQCVALCDVYEPNLELARKDAPQARPYLDYQDLLAHPGLDFVIIATPDHHHCPMLMDALEARKDIYQEKPISHSLEESAKMVAAVRKTRQVVQVGTQRRSAKLFQNAKKYFDDGTLGRISLVKVEWNRTIIHPDPYWTMNNSPLPGKLDWKRFLGRARPRPLEPMRFRSWRVFWDYSGGNMTDMGAHLVDLVQWLCNSGPPLSAICFGQVARMTGAETPDVFSSVFEYKDFMLTWTLNYCNAFENGLTMKFQGDKGTLVFNPGLRVYREPWTAKENREPFHTETAGADGLEAHIQNFLDCVRTRREPVCPIEVGAAGVAGTHMANLAFHRGARVKLT